MQNPQQAPAELHKPSPLTSLHAGCCGFDPSYLGSGAEKSTEIKSLGAATQPLQTCKPPAGKQLQDPCHLPGGPGHGVTGDTAGSRSGHAALAEQEELQKAEAAKHQGSQC